MRAATACQISDKRRWVVHVYMHNRGGLRRPGRGLFERYRNPNTEKPQLTFNRLTHRNPDTPQQNAALVEQMAAAASSLQNQADELVNAMAIFTVDDKTLPNQPQLAAPASAPVRLLTRR